ncbi:MAG TPA: hypothetical protein VKA81_06955 [Verrucomicrobiae bacterium]|nr:hypothetical protein [Verrucomicrobiae bacterium]
MRTKTLLLTAVLSAAGLASSLAQGTVYSVNAVGYINVSLSAGYTLIANQLNAAPNNSLETIFGDSLAAGDTVFKFNGTSFDSAIYAGGGSFLYSGSTFGLAPGEGAFVQTTAAKTVTLVGEVPQGTALKVSMPVGYSIVSSIVPQSAALGSIGFPVQAGDTVFFYTGTGFDSWIAADNTGNTWLPSNPSGPAQPTPAVGQSFFVQRGAAADWTRSFNVNQ